MCKDTLEMVAPRLGDTGSAGPWKSGKELGFNLTEFSSALLAASSRSQRLEKQALTPAGGIQFPGRHSDLLNDEALGREAPCRCLHIILNVSIIPFGL